MAGMLAMGGGTANAGSIVVRDELLKDLSITPALGRGYSLATNTFQSTCLTDVVKTTPSFNFYYKFSDGEFGDVDIDSKVMGEGRNPAGNPPPGGTPTTGTPGTTPGGATEQVTAPDGKKMYVHAITAIVVVEVYYASVDEAKSKMADQATALLTAKDLPGFFDGCGSYYVRSINRKGTFYSRFKYKTATAGRDEAFERQLEDQIKSFGGTAAQAQSLKEQPVLIGPQALQAQLPQGIPSTLAAGNSAIMSQVTAGRLAQEQTSRFAAVAASKELTIESNAEGLGRPASGQPGPKLLAYDIATFKDAIQEAFNSMMLDDAGMVTSMEVVPWVENIQFQAALALAPTAGQAPDAQGQTPPAPATAAAGGASPSGGATAPKGAGMSPYARKRILNLNGEFLAQIDRSARARLVSYYRAKMCGEELDANWRKPDKSFKYRFALNHRTGKKTPVEDLAKEVTDAKTNTMFDDYRNFLFGDTGGTKGVVPCVRGLLESDITQKQYREIPACVEIEKSLSVVSQPIVTEHCLPKLVD